MRCKLIANLPARSKAQAIEKIDWSSFPFEQAVLFPVALQTMHDALATQAHVVEGETALIQGASSSVGLMGLQIARLLGASGVLGTSTDVGRLAKLTEWGPIMPSTRAIRTGPRRSFA